MQQAKFMDFKIQNIVGSIDVGFSIRLECFHTCHSQFCSYEPELFPGLIYRLHEPKVVLLIFVSGKVVITGQSSIAKQTPIWSFILCLNHIFFSFPKQVPS